MKKFALLIVILIPLSSHLSGQRTNVFAAFQLIENEKFEEAKKAVDEALKDSKTKDWSRSWYARGLLCQRAYEKGIKDKNKKLCELYPEQLFVAYESFEKSLTYKRNARIADQLEPIYVILANDFMVMGMKEYSEKRYLQALKAYENALKINESSILSVQLDTNLLYNTAISAVKSQQHEKSIDLLNRLNEMKYSSNVPHLLFTVQLANGDTIAAESALREGISMYDDNKDLVLVFVDQLYKSGNFEEAVEVLDHASENNPEEFIFPFTKGLIYQKDERYADAIEAYKSSIKVDPERLSSYTGIGTCYFNIGVEREQNARLINDNKTYREEIAKSVTAKKNAVTWLEKALVKDPGNEVIKEQLLQLYRSLHMNEKIRSITP